jgi:hypothetical protein
VPEKNREEAAEALALKILRSARARLLLKMKYLDQALVRLPLRPTDEWKIACDGETLFFDPGYVLIRFREDETFALRVWLHVLMHWLFAHSLVGEDTDPDYWDLASDLFAEQLTASVCPEELASPQQNYRRQELAKFCGGIRPLTAEGIYRRLLDDPPDPYAFRELKKLVSLDDHRIWRGAAGAEKSGASKKGRKQGALSALGDLDETASDASSGEAEGTADDEVGTDLLDHFLQGLPHAADVDHELNLGNLRLHRDLVELRGDVLPETLLERREQLEGVGATRVERGRVNDVAEIEFGVVVGGDDDGALDHQFLLGRSVHSDEDAVIAECRIVRGGNVHGFLLNSGALVL